MKSHVHAHMTINTILHTCITRIGATVKPVLNGHSQKYQKLVFKTNYPLMQVKSIAECSKGAFSAIFSTFIKLPFVIKIFVLSIFEWPFYTGFTIVPSNIVQTTIQTINHSISSLDSTNEPLRSSNI